jgi:hypothetical protein
MYKLSKSTITGEIKIVLKEVEGVLYSIPFAEDNTDYQAYLAWVAEGNVPTPADEDTQ